MASAPWYLDNSNKPSLKHQRLRQDGTADSLNAEWYQRGLSAGPAATTFRKGACENCGAMTHKTKECTERPRSKGARWTKQGISADEVVQDVSGLGYAGKRDRWNGYDASGHASTFKRFEALEDQRKEERQRVIEQKLLKGETEVLEEDEARDTLGDATVGQMVCCTRVRPASHMMPLMHAQVDMGGATRMSVRNLRIREDTAKFLYNLDPNSAHYDPKTRSLRSNPNPEKDPSQVCASPALLSLSIVLSSSSLS
jgi:pre-mRNA-processing factor SLU7